DRRASRELLAEHGCKDGIARRALPGEPLGQRAEARNKTINRRRSRVEHVFAGLWHLGGKTVRAIGQARNELAIAIKCAVYNVKRLTWLKEKLPAF
uniref:transposase n=1 Tax=Caldimonas tepidiphila TaxID=2315841 RepID=UPI001300A968